MRTIVKKISVFLLAALLILSSVMTVFATSNSIYADETICEKGDRITVPIRIKDNSGFMGFSITVTYDADIFNPVSVTKGVMLSGMFNDSIATSQNNSFKVVFTGTENITTDGELFAIVFDVAGNVSGRYNIELDYSQPDTFSESWGNVQLNCELITVKVSYNEDETTTDAPLDEPSEPDEPTTKEPDEPIEEPADSKKLSERMRMWVNGLPVVLREIMSIFVLPLAFVVSLFE